EAERLCDQVGILDRGQLHAIGSPRELIEREGGGDRLEVSLSQPMELAEISALAGVDAVQQVNGNFVLAGKSGGKMLASLAVYADRQGKELLEARINHTSLEDVYLSLTGRRIGE
ncbi:MAG: hypothetical protein ACRD2D_00230, partial [Terriglobales bacterium]